MREKNRYCSNCGTELRNGAVFCPECGKRVEIVNSKDTEVEKLPEKRKHYLIKIILGIFLIVAIGGASYRLYGAMNKNVRGEKTYVKKHNKKDNVENKKEKSKKAKVKAEKNDNVEQNDKKETSQSETTTNNISSISMDHIKSLNATSELSEYEMTHIARNVIDGNKATAWVEGADGQGIGEKLVFRFDNTYAVEGIKIRSGYQKSGDSYFYNSRPKEITIGFSDGTIRNYTLRDQNDLEQTISLGEKVETESISITIESVYEGDKYEDTCISEISFY